MPTLRIVVNGVAHEVTAGPDTALVYVLRNHLGLKGTRFGCGLGVCGACTVLVDGAPVQSCDTPMWSVTGRAVTTVEGLAGHPLPQAFLDEQAGQCGYCLSGILVRSAALLAATAASAQDAAPIGVSSGAVFEVASVKPSNPNPDPANPLGQIALMLPQPGGRFTATNTPLRMLIMAAYELHQDAQLTGGPPTPADHLQTVCRGW